MRDILLIDNGSKRADAILSLRRIASGLAERLGETVHPVSLLHSDRAPPSALHGQPADTFEPFLSRRLSENTRRFLILPLFFGPSRAISDYVPERIAALKDDFGPFDVRIARALCPLPEGEPDLVEILLDRILETASEQGVAPLRILLVDHGSPIPAVTEVRRWLARQLAQRLADDRGPRIELGEAVMERRPGAEYDFNGELLEDRLRALAAENISTPVILSMLFLSPGRHAGPGGDIAEICASVERDNPGFRVHPSALVGGHPRLLDILTARVAEMEAASAITTESA
ncbi:sirohydrochlorin chelatase [Thiocapsa roseopersicina]|uniref:Sirohydrochlorin ferrochelatase n=1 Tax=Thiocapsa roseopersicina TaxID=1058 RepID=A0A1H3CIU6_THIRO|nr:CbiX/SirB N-terminal domain-containing protein [Thiocapsa roseopersicina]SDX53514.1 Sirohydrochlorin ferrochelatase [Thiocapsa roseopersicina]